MHTIDTRRRIPLRLTGALVALLVTLGLDASASACSENECDFRPDHTVIRADLWKTACDAAGPRALDSRHYGQGVRAPASFMRGVCLVERMAHGLPVYGAAADPTRTPVEHAISELQQAQSAALLPSQRHTAALLEGVMHCKAITELAQKRAPEGSDRRCYHRAAAKASFARVDLAGLSITYPEPENATRYDVLVETMLACQETLLAREAAACGIRHAATASELQQIVARAGDEVLPRYFGADSQNADGEKAISPVTAMIGRKITEAQAASDGSQRAFDGLRAKRDQLLRNYQLLAARICEGGGGSAPGERSCSFPGMGRLLAAYDAAIQEVAKYTAFVEQSVEGLLRDETTPDVSKNLADSLRAARETVARLAPKHEALSALKDDLARLAVDPQGTETIRRACRLLFCDIYGDLEFRVSRACVSTDPASSSGELLITRNPLCSASRGKAEIAPGFSAESICRAAGFDPASPSCP